MKKILTFIVFTLSLFAYDVYVYEPADMFIMNNLGIECQKQNKGYLCAKYNSMEKAVEFKNYLSQFGINAVIKNNTIQKSGKYLKTGYCIQVLSSTKLKPIKKIYDKIKDFSDARIEKIGRYYTLRVGESKNSGILKKILQKIKKYNFSSFIRKCDYIPSRIVMGKIIQTPSKRAEHLKTRSTVKEIKNLNDKQMLSLLKKYINEKQYKKALILSQLLQKTFYRKDALVYKGIILYKMRKFEDSCMLLKKLSAVYDNSDKQILKYEKESCYEYNLQKVHNEMFLKPYVAYDYLKQAFIYKKDIRGVKDLIYLLFEMQKYQDVLNTIEKNSIKKDGIYGNIYAISLFKLNKISELQNFCITNNVRFCKDFENYKNAELLLQKGNIKKAYEIATKLEKFYPDDSRINYLMAEISYKQGNIVNALFYANKIKSKIPGLYKMLRDLYAENNDIINAYKYALICQKNGNKSTKNRKIIEEYRLYEAYKDIKKKDFKNALNILKTLNSDNLEVLELKGDAYYGLGDFNNALKNYKIVYYVSPDEDIVKKMIKIYFFKKEFAKAENMALNSDKNIQNDYFLNLAEYYIQNNQILKAKEALKNISKYNGDYYLYKGIIAYKQQNYNKALDLLQKATQNSKRKCYIILAYLKLGKISLVKQMLRNINIRNTECRKKLIGVYIQLGEIKKAKELLKRID